MAKILLVDDDEDFVSIHRMILEHKGYEVDSAGDPDTAREKIKTSKPDLILLDVMMPAGTEGFHLAYEIRQNKESSAIPIMMITSIHEHTDLRFSPDEDGDYLPVDDFIEKPIKADVLIAKVEKLLGSKYSPPAQGKKDKGLGLKKPGR